MKLKSINPVNFEVIAEYTEDSNTLIQVKIEKSYFAFSYWRKTSFKERASLMLACQKTLLDSKKYFAELITMEMGKPISQSIAEVEKCALLCDYYAVNAEKFLSTYSVASDASESYVSYEPLGPVLSVMPWNFPFWQVFRFAVPAIMAGNSALLKHAANVSGCAMAIEDVFLKAGFPQFLFQSLIIGSDKVEQVINHKYIQAVTLTGSEKAGSIVASQAGKCIKKVVLELGGSDPFIVLKDANLEEAASIAIKSRFGNNGQSCIAAKRFIVEKSVYDKFSELVLSKVKRLNVGNPMDDKIDLGPMARIDLVEGIEKQLKESVYLGAKILCGGERVDLDGAFFQPTVLDNVSKGMPAFDEEIFGPVLSLIKADSEDDCIFLANDCKYGLGASIWTTDIEKAKRMAKYIDSGSVFINGLVKSDPRLPFGGIKLSGYGRELSDIGIKEFVNIKTVWVK
jgi:succinate-semialdehyde dehydrogenase/glutarate-semialdehyde dehydrogenase